MLPERSAFASLRAIAANAGTWMPHPVRCVSMLLTIAVVLVVLWLLGFVMHLAGGLIHIVLVIAVIMFVLHFVRGRSGGV